ncbi:DUF350 domain-containing protein [Oleisolibacter albus]|uniref:DUF350 domain-containing protein n=1 Tax=Oleisolibacter albus TaxID=2171757 RepID=UPI000DF33E10|nr:DUF350 domain-containing protein [Oleisolibacter albus]
MHAYLADSAANLPAYLAYLGTMVAMLFGFAWIYLRVTPYHELDLIRRGNKAAALSYIGAITGFAIAMKTVAAGTTALADLAMWGVIALVTQLAVFFFVSRLLRDLREGIESDRVSYGILLGGISLATGLLNAGALTY